MSQLWPPDEHEPKPKQPEMPEWWIQQMATKFIALMVTGDRSIQELARTFGCSDDQARLVINRLVEMKKIIHIATPPSSHIDTVYGLVHHGRIVTGE